MITTTIILDHVIELSVNRLIDEDLTFYKFLFFLLIDRILLRK